MTDPVTDVPVDPAESELDSFETTPPSIEDRIARTDAHLGTWREESVRRREEWEAAEAERLAELQARRRWLVPLLFGAGLGSAVAMFAALALLAGPWLAAPVVEPVAEVEPNPVEVEPAPVVAEPPAPVEVAEAPVIVERPAEVAAVQAVPLEAATVELWRDDAHHWVKFAVGTDEPVWIHWLDAAGEPALEPMGCAPAEGGEHLCRAGRTHYRIAKAISEGATPGEWTVRACGSAGCTEVGSFSAP